MTLDQPVTHRDLLYLLLIVGLLLWAGASGWDSVLKDLLFLASLAASLAFLAGMIYVLVIR